MRVVLTLLTMIHAKDVDELCAARNMCNMKNLTLRIDEKVLESARRIAADRSTSVNAMIREYLEELATVHDRREQARKEILRLCRESTASSGGRKWKREEIYDRGRLSGH
jgi:hypothetical protein